jgi:hypothetical protein
MRVGIFFFGALLGCGVCAAQVPPQFRLYEARAVPSSERVTGLFMPVKCDDNGDLYFRGAVTGERPKVAARTLKKLSRDGFLRTRFSFDASPELKGLDPYDFAVRPDGEVYASAAGPEDVYIVEFDGNGNFKSKIKLDTLLKPTQMAVFKSGEFLVSGVELPVDASANLAPHIGVYDRRGKLIKKVTPDDDSGPSAQQNVRETSNTQDELKGINQEVEFGIALSAKDGNIYLMRRSMPTIVYVIAPTGDIVRTLKVELQRKPQSLLPGAMHMAAGQLLLMFESEQEQVFALVDASTGEILTEFVGDPALGAAFGCYKHNEFTFLTTKQGMLYLTFAAPR